MREFAAIILLGLAVSTVVALVGQVREVPRPARTFLFLLLGAVATWITDYSVFADWGIRFRALWMGPVATGLVVGGLGSLWHEVFGLLASAQRVSPEAPPVEARLEPRAAA
jgi:hypothetical protein